MGWAIVEGRKDSSSMENEIETGLLSYYATMNIEIRDVRRISDGWENEVYSFTLEHTSEQKHDEMILRIYPGDHASQKAAKEFHGMRKLYELGYPVPRVFILEPGESPFGKPFVIMEKIDGRSMRSVFDESAGEKRKELLALFCRMFVDLHSLDWKPFAQYPSIYEMGDPYSFIKHLLADAQEHMDRFQRYEFSPVLNWLKERYLDVPCERFSVIHLDYHPNNILIQDDGRAFVIDWTNIGVADPRMDLAWTLLLTSTYGNPEAREIILDEYERIADHKVNQIEYFEVIASLRRLFSILVSLSAGADKLGMRPEAVAMMKQQARHVENVYSILRDRTGIGVPEVEAMIMDLIGRK